MAIYTIGDLHLSFSEHKPMNVFGEIWNDYEEKIKKDWMSKVKKEDTVLLLGDFSWSMKLSNTLMDFEYINNLPGKKILLKGNHDYWWSTVTNMKKFLNENNIDQIDFLYNNSFEVEDKIFCGTRGWSVNFTNDIENNKKMIDRECNRLKLSIESAKKMESNKEIIVCMHYPPITQNDILKNESTAFIKLLKEFNIKKCYYGHLHGESIKDAVQGEYDGIELKLVSADGVDFKLQQIK